MIELLDNNVMGDSSSGGGGESTKYNMSLSYYLGDVNSNGVLQKPNATAELVLTGVKDVVAGVLGKQFKGSTRLLSVSAPDLEEVTSDFAFSEEFMGSSIKSASFSKLKEISGGNAFEYIFKDCSGLENIDFPALEEITNSVVFTQAFGGTSLTTVSFPALKTISGPAIFANAFYESSVSSISFPALTTISNIAALIQMLSGTTNVTVHFPAAIQATVEGLSGYPDFSGTTPTILFDL